MTPTAFHLPASPVAGVPRKYAYVRLGLPVADGYVTIQTGEPGPRGGRSHVSVESYFVQVVEPDPESPPGPVEVLLAKDGPGYEVYPVRLYRGRARCRCTGYQTGGDCKHCAAVWHMVRVVGILDILGGRDYGEPAVADSVSPVPHGGDDGGWVEW